MLSFLCYCYWLFSNSEKSNAIVSETKQNIRFRMSFFLAKVILQNRFEVCVLLFLRPSE